MTSTLQVKPYCTTIATLIVASKKSPPLSLAVSSRASLGFSSVR